MKKLRLRDVMQALEALERKFTSRGGRVVRLANREACQLGHEYVSPSHLFLALIKEGRGVAVKMALEGLGCKRRQLQQDLKSSCRLALHRLQETFLTQWDLWGSSCTRGRRPAS